MRLAKLNVPLENCQIKHVMRLRRECAAGLIADAAGGHGIGGVLGLLSGWVVPYSGRCPGLVAPLALGR